MPRACKPPYERVMAKVRVDAATGCWLFEGGRNEHGHGTVQLGRRGSPFDKAHRISFRHHKGEIPAHLVVRHRCDVANCVNPEHLILGTQLENVHDSIERGRWRNGATGRLESCQATAADYDYTPERSQWF